jgi:hypothetical protein
MMRMMLKVGVGTSARHRTGCASGGGECAVGDVVAMLPSKHRIQNMPPLVTSRPTFHLAPFASGGMNVRGRRCQGTWGK